jgi:hypothetical protein
MHFYETCPFTIYALNTPNVIHTLGQVQTQIHTKQTEIYKEHDKKEINATNAQR